MYRKITGGVRSAEGGQALAPWMTVTQAFHKQGRKLQCWSVETEAVRQDRACFLRTISAAKWWGTDPGGEDRFLPKTGKHVRAKGPAEGIWSLRPAIVRKNHLFASFSRFCTNFASAPDYCAPQTTTKTWHGRLFALADGERYASRAVGLAAASDRPSSKPNTNRVKC